MSGLSTKAKVFLALGLYLLITVLLVRHRRQRRRERGVPAAERVPARSLDRAHDRRRRHLDHKAVFYLLLASGLTIGAMVFIANRMQREPNKVQMAVELAYDLTRNNITGGNIPDQKLARKWFPYLAGALLLHLVLEHARLPAAADQHRAQGRHLRARGAVARDLRRDREHLDPARAGADLW